MSKRNTKAVKARRRKERAAWQRRAAARAAELPGLVEVHSLGQMTALAERGEQLPCGCGAHELMHDMLGIDAPPIR